MAKYLCLQHIHDHRPFVLVQGYYLDPKNHSEWVAASNYNVPDGVTVKAGSIVDMNLPQYRQSRAARNNILAPLSEMENHHFNLETIFGHDIVDHFDGKPALITDVLHEYGIFTLEQIAEEKEGTVPLTPQGMSPSKIGMRQILSTLCENDQAQVNAWIKQARDAVKAAKLAEPKPPEGAKS